MFIIICKVMYKPESDIRSGRNVPCLPKECKDVPIVLSKAMGTNFKKCNCTVY